MLADAFGEVIIGVFKIITFLFADLIFEVLIKGFGYLICYPFNHDLDPDGLIVLFTGISYWAALLLFICAVY